MQEPRKHLLDLGLSDSEVTVYLSMISGSQTARDLIKVTRMKRPTVYYALSCLEKRGLISKSGQEGDKRLSLEPLEKLAIIAKEKMLEFSKLQESIDEMIPTLEATASPANFKPTVSFFEGIDAVKHTIMEMLYCKGRQINAVVPKENFFWQIGRDFVEQFVKERVKRNISTKNLWEESVDPQIIKDYYQGHSEIRIVPDVMKGKFQSTIFLFDDKTLYVSSKNNSYCILITSQEHKDTMQAWFDGLWSVSLPHEK